MATAPLIGNAEADYLAMERATTERHEFRGDQVRAMAGASPRQNLISANVIGTLRALLATRPCFVLQSDQRIRVASSRLYTYPDASVVCGQLEIAPEDDQTLVNPLLIVEVLSDSTESYDRGDKFADYRTVASFREYVLVSQRDRHVEVYHRVDVGHWMFDGSARQRRDHAAVAGRRSAARRGLRQGRRDDRRVN